MGDTQCSVVMISYCLLKSPHCVAVLVLLEYIISTCIMSKLKTSVFTLVFIHEKRCKYMICSNLSVLSLSVQNYS